MGDQKTITIGQAIDGIVAALEQLDESARQTAVRAACEHLGIRDMEGVVVAGTVRKSVGEPIPDTLPDQITPQQPAMDIRTLREEKQPDNSIEMACIVAYYLQTIAPPNERTDTVTKEDLDKYFKQANQKLPKRLDQTLVDAKSAGYFDSPSRGKYKLNPVGHNLVVHTLPRAKV